MKANQKQQQDHSTAVEEIKYQLAAGKPAPTNLPKELPLTSVKVNTAVFQHRVIKSYISEQHIKNLLTVLTEDHGTKNTDPVVIWWNGKQWICIDGHHRLEAYRRAGRESIPTEAFNGTLGEAITRSLSDNSKYRLQMDKPSMLKTAWNLTVDWHQKLISISKANTASMSRVCPRTVAKMRTVAKELTERHPARPLPDSWDEAQRLHKGLSGSEHYGDDWREKKAQEIKDKLIKTFGKSLGKVDTEILANALEAYNQHMYESLRDWISKASDLDYEDEWDLDEDEDELETESVT